MEDSYSYVALTNIKKHPYVPAVKIDIKIGEVLEVSDNGYFKTPFTASDISGDCFIPVECLLDNEQVFKIGK